MRHFYVSLFVSLILASVAKADVVQFTNLSGQQAVITFASFQFTLGNGNQTTFDSSQNASYTIKAGPVQFAGTVNAGNWEIIIGNTSLSIRKLFTVSEAFWSGWTLSIVFFAFAMGKRILGIITHSPMETD